MNDKQHLLDLHFHSFSIDNIDNREVLKNMRES